MIGTHISAYEILAELGSGGMGSVYLATCAEAAAGLEADTRVALKVIHPNLLSQPGFFKRFLREAQIGQDVQHENVVRTYDCDATDVDGAAAHFLVMEYVEGQTLRNLLEELERVPEELCRHIGREVAKGLAAIHKAGVVHRDIKPENVLITEEHVVKVMDLGVARLADEVIRLSQTGAFVGSLEYAAPEQFRSGECEPDGRADLHSLGVVLYELATGQHPYRDEDIAKLMRNILDEKPRKVGEVNPQLSPFFEEVVTALLAKDRDARFADAASLASVLEDGEKSDWWKERAKALRIETKRPLRRIRIPRETALYGRDDDLAKLHALFDAAKSGEGRVLLIEGEAGIGKTRLVEEFVGRVRQEGEDINFLFGSYPPGGAATVAGAFSDAYREQFGVQGLESTLESYLAPSPMLVPAFAAILKGEPVPGGAAAMTKDALQTVFVHATRGLAAERPTIVLIDDLHFAPEEGRALFSSLAMAAPGHRVLLLGTMRPGVPEDWAANVTRLDHAEHRSLLRLGPKDLTRLLQESFRSERLALELAGRIAIKCDGNPFFAFEIIRGLREGQFISQQPDGTWITTKVIQDIQVPSSVIDLVNARIADLSDEERDLLDVAACCGFEFEAGLVADAVGAARIPALKQFGRIERKHRLLRTAGRMCVFDHHQVQEALYGSLMPELREAYHAAIAGALEIRANALAIEPDELDGPLCVSLCEHLLRGRQGERALRYLDAALAQLEQGFQIDQVVGLLDRVLEIPRLLSDEERVAMLLRMEACLSVLCRRDEQARVLEEARALAHDPRVQPGIEKAEGRLHADLGNTAASRECYERGLALARAAGDRWQEAAVELNLGVLLFNLGRFEEALPCHQRALAVAQDLGDAGLEVFARGNLANIASLRGEYEQALEARMLNLAFFQEARDGPHEALSRANIGIELLLLAQLAEARNQLSRSLALARETGSRWVEALALRGLSSASGELGRLTEARAYAEQCITLAREIGARRDEGVAADQLAWLASEGGEDSSAVVLAQAALGLRREIEHADGVIVSLNQLGLAHMRAGNDTAARDALETSRRLIGDQELRGMRTYVLALLANLPGGDAAAAVSSLEVDRGSRYPVAYYYLWRATGESTYLAEAKHLLDLLVEHAPKDCRVSMLMQVRRYREIMDAWNEQAAS